MNNKELMLKVEQLIKDKKYDKRFAPMIITFFSLYNKVHNISEKELDEIIQNYRENVDNIEYFNIGRDKNIVSLSAKSLVMDTSYAQKIDEKNIDNYLLQAVQVQSIAIQKNPERLNEDEIELIKLNTANNLCSTTNPKVNNLLQMLLASYGTQETRIEKIMQEFKREYDKAYENNDNQKRYYYDDMMYGTYREIKEAFIECNKIGKPNESICKKIYALCMLNLNAKVQSLDEDNNNIKYYQIIKRNMREIQEEYGIQDEELESIEIKKNWKLPTKEIENTLIQTLGISEKEIEENESCRPPIVKKSKLITITNSQMEEKTITKAEIEEEVKQMTMENQFPEETIGIMNEYFNRSMQVYKWDRETALKKMENFKINVKKFELAKLDKGTEAQSVGIDKSIKFNKRYRNASNSRMLNIVFHEMRHKTDLTERHGIQLENGQTVVAEYGKTNGLTEMFVEGGTQLLIGEKYTDDLNTTLKFGSYESYQYILSMLSGAIGLNEIELLKLGDNGIAKLKEEIIDRCNNSEIANKIEEINDIISGIALTEGSQIKSVGRKVKSELLGNIYNICQEMYQLRMVQNPPSTEEEKIQAKYEEYKIGNNLLLAGRFVGMNIKKLEETTGKNIKQIKEEATLTKEEKKKIKDEIIPKSGTIKWENKEAKQKVRAFIKSVKRGKNTKVTNLLPPGKPAFKKDLKVEQTEELQFDEKYFGVELVQSITDDNQDKKDFDAEDQEQE